MKRNVLIILAFLVGALSPNIYKKQAKAFFYNDAYSVEDDFSDYNGIEISTIKGFANLGDGNLSGTKKNSFVESKCLSLPQPSTGIFQSWSFLDFYVENTSTLSSGTFSVSDCSNNPLIQLTSFQEGVNSVDLSGIDPVLHPNIKLSFDAIHISPPNSGSNAIKLDYWNIYGDSDGITSFGLSPDSLSVDSGETITFNVSFSSNGAITKNPIIKIDLADINGDGIIPGLSEDATVCYDINLDSSTTPGECDFYRPLEFVSASTGPSGETPTTPTTGETQGEIIWNLDDISDGYSGSVNFTLKVPKGYIDGKSLAASASLTYGSVSENGVLDSTKTISATSNSVNVISVSDFRLSYYTQYSNLGPGATSLGEYFYILNLLGESTNASDGENVVLEITAENSSCIPTFNRLTNSSIGNFPITTETVINSGDLLDSAHMVKIRFFRVNHIQDSSNAATRFYFNVPNTCLDGEKIKIDISVENADPDNWSGSTSRTHPIVVEACRTGGPYVMRSMSGNTTSYSYFTGQPEYYINNGFIRAGEYFLTWTPYGDASNRTHTITLDQSIVLADIPSGTTFHGIRYTRETDRIYKDSTGTALNPLDPSFDRLDPTNSGWKTVDIAWNGPFTTSPDDNDPSAVIQENSRLLIIKDKDNPSWIEPDLGNFRPTLLLRMCDGSFGCNELSEGTDLNILPFTIYTYQETVSPFMRQCSSSPGWDMIKESVSMPKIFNFSPKVQIPAGDVAEIILNPHNHNNSSMFPSSVWGINLFEIRDYVDLQNITGSVFLDGGNTPAQDQNIIGESCDLNEVIFNLPNENTCLNSADPNSTDCFAYWEMPNSCQPPNGWGYRDYSTDSQNNYTQLYKLKANIPIKNNSPAGTILNFNSEIRTTDLSDLGADNVADISKWPTNNFTDTIPVEVLENPAVDIEQSGPSTWPYGSTFSYNITSTNKGNAPNKGIFTVNLLPKLEINGSEFTPTYGKIYSDLPATDVVFEYSDDTNCFSSFNSSTWNNISSTSTLRTNFNSESIIPIPSTAHCVRSRLNQSSTIILDPEDSFVTSVDISIQNDPLVDGQSIYTKSLVGASTTFSSSTDITAVETTNLQTTVGNNIALDIEKTSEVDFAKPGMVKWIIKFRNISGSVATNAEILDQLPDELVFGSLANPLNPILTCQNPECAPSNTNPDGSGGTIQITISALDPDDGSPDSGTDEGEISFWMREIPDLPAGINITNCSSITPSGSGIGAQDCADISTSLSTPSKSQSLNPTISGHPNGINRVDSEIAYNISVTNNESSAKYISVNDELQSDIEYILGTLKINGFSASDSLISNSLLNYQTPTQILPGELLNIEFKASPKPKVAPGTLIHNSATVTFCQSKTDLSACILPENTNQTEAVVVNLHPIANDDFVETYETLDIDILPLVNDSDSDGTIDSSSLKVITNPINGSISLDIINQKVVYSPNTGFLGLDQIIYEICDNDGACTSATIEINVIDVWLESSVTIDKPVSPSLDINNAIHEFDLSFTQNTIVLTDSHFVGVNTNAPKGYSVYVQIDRQPTDDLTGNVILPENLGTFVSPDFLSALSRGISTSFQEIAPDTNYNSMSVYPKWENGTKFAEIPDTATKIAENTSQLSKPEYLNTLLNISADRYQESGNYSSVITYTFVAQIE